MAATSSAMLPSLTIPTSPISSSESMASPTPDSPSSPSSPTSSDDLLATREVAPFLKQLRRMLEEESAEVLRWTTNGRAFEILDMKRMTEYVLPKYFKHRKYTSFQRQLNYFNFRKWTKSKATVCTFSNECFLRDEPDLAWRITRKKSSHPAAHSAHSKLGAPRGAPLPQNRSMHHVAKARQQQQANAAPASAPRGWFTEALAMDVTPIPIPMTDSCSSSSSTNCSSDAAFSSPTDVGLLFPDSDYAQYMAFAQAPPQLEVPTAIESSSCESLEWIDALLPFVDRIEDDVLPCVYSGGATAAASFGGMPLSFDYIPASL